MLHTTCSIGIGIGIGSGQYYWILGGFLGIVLTLLSSDLTLGQAAPVSSRAYRNSPTLYQATPFMTLCPSLSQTGGLQPPPETPADYNVRKTSKQVLAQSP